mgnify:CR=1 FL=1
MIKSSEFHRQLINAEKGVDGIGFKEKVTEVIGFMKTKWIRYPVPYHGSKEIGEGLRKKIIKDMELE